jgi:hypothetical protein
MKATKANQWFLVKADWMEDFKDLSDADFGNLLRSLYLDECPEGTQKILFKALREEFVRVNEKRTTANELRKAGSEKANANKAQRALLSKLEEAHRGEINAHIDDRVYDIENREKEIENKEYNIDISIVEGIINHLTPSSWPNGKMPREGRAKLANEIFK